LKELIIIRTLLCYCERKKNSCIFKAHLVAFDDIMLLPVTKTDVMAFFNFINQLYERAVSIRGNTSWKAEVILLNFRPAVIVPVGLPDNPV
jgi:hypothetical protein